jgi:inhibitor of KinA sporulation pathway (predicted exonuclease)
MIKKLDRILVVDLESTCWQGVPPPGQEREIIEIGLCVLDVASLERAQARGFIVRPEHSAVSEYCTALTTLTQEAVDSGMSLAEACGILRDQYDSRQRVWASYGDYDRLMMERSCQARGIEYPFGTRHINVKSLFSLALGLKKEAGLDEALRIMGWPLEGTHHRGVDDAWNIARILAHLLSAVRGG